MIIYTTNSALLTDSTVIYSVSSPTVTTSQSDDGKQQDGGENGAVVGAVVSTVIIVGVTVGIIAVLWLWRRYTHIGGWHIHVKQYLLCILCVIKWIM